MNIYKYSLKYFVEFMLCIWILMFSTQISNIGPVPIKAIFALLFMASAIFLIINKRYVILYNRWLIYLVFCGVTICFVVGAFNNYYSALSQLTILLSSIAVVYFSIVLHQNSMLCSQKLERVIYLTAKIAITIKICMAIIVMLEILPVENLNSFMQNYMGSPGFEMSIHNGFMGLIPRIGNSGDAVYLIIFLFYCKNNNSSSTIYFWILILSLVLISNSRYLFIIFVFVSVLALNFNKQGVFCKFLGVTAAIAIISSLYMFSSSENVLMYIVERYTGVLSIEADLHRAEQGIYLLDTFKENVFFGIGMGGYLHDLVRDEGRMWHYELEYLAMLMQFGLIGFVMIVVGYTSWLILAIFKSYNDKLKLQIILALIIWLVTPFQSALFIGSSGAFIILSVFFLSRKTSSMKASDLCKLERSNI